MSETSGHQLPMIPAAHPLIGEEEVEAVSAVLRSGMVAQGPQVEAFEEEFSREVVGGVQAVAVNSGTSALHLGLLAAGFAAAGLYLSTLTAQPMVAAAATFGLLLGFSALIILALGLSGWGLSKQFRNHAVQQIRTELLTHIDYLNTQFTIDAKGRPDFLNEFADPRFNQRHSGLY